MPDDEADEPDPDEEQRNRKDVEKLDGNGDKSCKNAEDCADEKKSRLQINAESEDGEGKERQDKEAGQRAAQNPHLNENRDEKDGADEPNPMEDFMPEGDRICHFLGSPDIPAEPKG